MRTHARIALSILGIVVLARPALAADPIGTFEAIDANGILTGWAQDPDTPSTAITVHVFMDGPFSQGTIIGTTTASYPRQDVGAHGFRFALPPKAFDGQPHAYYIYAIDTDGLGTHNVLLTGSPRAATMASTRVFVSNGILTVGVEPRCGGTIVSVVLSGSANLVNNGDCTGRQVQVALYDSAHSYDQCAGCTDVFGWDPNQGGDRHGFGSSVTTSSFTPTSAYTSAQANEWYPDDKGGGPGQPIVSDVTIEQWITFVAGHTNAAKVHVKITHLGSDSHRLAFQPFPAVYVNRGYDTLLTYDGTVPWTNGSTTSFGSIPSTNLYSPERWAAFVNGTGFGLFVYVPSQFPWFTAQQAPGQSGEFGGGYNTFVPLAPMEIGPSLVWEGDYYVVAGDASAARATIYALHTALGPVDLFGPYGFLDAPANGATISGTVAVAGWSMDEAAISAVRIVVDGADKGAATYGIARPGIPMAFPHAPPNTGYSFALDTTQLANGPHRIEARSTDSSAHTVTLIRPIVVTVANKHAPCGGESLAAGSTPIRAQHVNELRACIAAARAGYSLPPFTYTNTIVAGSVVKAIDILEMRTALASVYSTAALSAPAYTDANLGPGTIVKSAHILELRSAVDQFR